MLTELSLRAAFEPLQYLAFFGALTLFGLAELVLPMRAGTERRQRWPANLTLTAINILILSVIPVTGLAAADWAVAQELGLLPWLGIGGAAAVALGILARSLTNWAIHVAMHKIPFLWRLHRIHHTDDRFDVSTAVRFHPAEFLISLPVALVSIVALGVPPVAIILYELADAAMAVWTHANIRLPRRADRLIGFLLVTPDMHRLHHSSHQPETDSNYGATLSVWDRLFGTYRTPSRRPLETLTLGLEECQDPRNRSLLWLLLLPLAKRLARQAKEGPT